MQATTGKIGVNNMSEHHGSIKDVGIMILANGILHELINEEQAVSILRAMDSSSKGNPIEIDERARAVSPIFTSLTKRYLEEGGK